MSRRHAGWAVGVSLLATLATSSPGRAQDLASEARQRLFYSVKPAVTWFLVMAEADIQLPTDKGVLRMKSGMGNSGSGWIISPDGFVVTNGHVVELFHAKNEERLKMQLFFSALEENYFPAVAKQAGRQLTNEEKMQIFAQLYPKAQIVLKKDLTVFTQNWKKYSGEVKQYSAPIFPIVGKVSFPGQDIETGKDVAIVKIEGKDLPTVKMGNSDAVQIGDEIFPAGYPGVVFSHGYLSQQTALEATFTRGQISSVKLDVKGTNVLQMDASTTHGNSGGPVFNSKGEVVGMATFGSVSEQGPVPQEIQGFNFAVPVNTVKEFVRASGVPIGQASLFDDHWTRALNAYYGGQHKQAIAEFEEALRIMPDLPDAIKLRRQSMLALEQAPKGLPIWLRYGIGAAAVVGLLVLGLGVLVRRRGRKGGVTRGQLPAGRLVVREGPLQGNFFPIPPIGVRIGRDAASCQLVLAESTVSREHAVITRDGTTVRIRNLSATNPTYVNDRAITDAELKDGDRIKIGTALLTYEKSE